MKKISLLFLLIITYSSFAQTDSLKLKEKNYAKNTVYFELLGNGGIYSFNYDRIILSKNKIKCSFNAGLSYGGIGSLLNPKIIGSKYIELLGWSAMIPCGISFIYGKKHSVELGTGPTFTFNVNNKNHYGSSILFHVINLNYRFQKKNGGFFFKTGVVIFKKLLEYKNEWLFNNEGAVTFNFGIGYTLKSKKKN